MGGTKKAKQNKDHSHTWAKSLFQGLGTGVPKEMDDGNLICYAKSRVAIL